MTRHIVVVESPAKAKTINKYLGPDYRVLASYGHIRDLPAKDGSVRPDDDFSMSWDVDSKSAKRVKDIADAVKGADSLILATDPDREGEAISWHVLEILQKKRALKDISVKRVVFNAITKKAVTDAIAHPRDIDAPLVDAYLARRALDYLVGFTLSPVLWRKLPGSRSAGRVQSVALRLICDRELEIERFVAQEYWSILAKLKAANGAEFEARLTADNGTKLKRHDIPNEAEAMRLKALLESAAYTVESVESKPQRRNPQPPFTTSTLQQEASRKLGFSASRTMQVAQKLYEGVDVGGETAGLITYMRTDAVQITPEAVGAIRSAIENTFGGKYLPEKPRYYATKAKNAQEAHEAIRPVDVRRMPRDVSKTLGKDEAQLYTLIWNRSVASQMESAVFERTTADIAAISGADRLTLRATGSVPIFDGFLRLYQEGRDDEENEENRRLPPLKEGDTPEKLGIKAEQHFTEPPPRYSEASLVKRMEELGIGRPSTYASTLQTLQDRGHVVLEKRRFMAEDKGRLVTAFLESFFTRYVGYDFTASLEEDLDRISAGELSWKDVLRRFWTEFSETVDGIKDLRVSQVLDALNEILGDHIFPDTGDGKEPRACPSCEDGQLSLKVGRYGAFIGCSNYPECRYTRQLVESGNGKEAKEAAPDTVLGQDPETGLDIHLKSGRFGPYVECASTNGEKPRRSSIPKGVDPKDVDLQYALRLLSLPREVGLHPETGKPITAGIGRYGPFVQHAGTFANLESVQDVFEIGLNRAVTVIAEKAASSSRRGPQVLKELGEHPGEGGPVKLMDGRYGPYVNHGKVNATLPKGTDPETVSLDQAIALIAAKADSKKKKPAKAKKTASASSKKKTTKAAKAAPKSEPVAEPGE